MLKRLEKEDKVFSTLCRHDAFGTRIAAFSLTYGFDCPFACFYRQEAGEKASAALSVIDGAATICHTGAADLEELGLFLQTLGCRAVLCGANTFARLSFQPDAYGHILEYRGNGRENAVAGRCTRGFELRGIYDILNHSAFTGLPAYEIWLADTAARIRKGTARVTASFEEGRPVSTASALFETDSAVVIGAVATLPEFRGRGYAGMLVGALAEESAAAGKKVNLLCAHGDILDFYQTLGFVKAGEWASGVKGYDG